VYLVGLCYTDISRCTVNKPLKNFKNFTIYTPATSIPSQIRLMVKLSGRRILHYLFFHTLTVLTFRTSEGSRSLGRGASQRIHKDVKWQCS